jgi:hypothetical protein
VLHETMGGNGHFGFTTTGGDALPGSFLITTSGGPPGSGSQTFTGIDTANTYSVTETGVPSSDWTFVTASCVDQGGRSVGTPSGAGVSGIRVSPGGTVTCTFADTRTVVSTTVTSSTTPIGHGGGNGGAVVPPVDPKIVLLPCANLTLTRTTDAIAYTTTIAFSNCTVTTTTLRTYPNQWIVPANIDGASMEGIPYQLGQDVYVKGWGFTPYSSFRVYLVNETDVRNYAVQDAVASIGVKVDAYGRFGPVRIWQVDRQGRFNLWADVNNKGKYDSGIDFVNSVEASKASVITAPEFSELIVPILILSMIFANAVRRKRLKTKTHEAAR